jgi:hypothetical protein
MGAAFQYNLKRRPCFESSVTVFRRVGLGF